MKKTMYGYRGLDNDLDYAFDVRETELGYSINKFNVKKDQNGEIFFQSDKGTCIVNVNGQVYNGAFELDGKKLFINIPGFTRGTVELHQFKFKK